MPSLGHPGHAINIKAHGAGEIAPAEAPDLGDKVGGCIVHIAEPRSDVRSRIAAHRSPSDLYRSMHDLMSATAWPSASRLPGAPDRIRTCDLCLRRATLYPAELRAPRAIQYPIVGRGATGVWADEQPSRRHSPLIEPFDSMPPAPSGLAPAGVNVARAFRQSKPCRWSRHDCGAVTGVTSPGHGSCR